MRQEGNDNGSKGLQGGAHAVEEQHEFRRCANCEIEFLWSPTIMHSKVYCCAGCANGGPCCCDYSEYSSVTISGVIHYGPDEEVPNKNSSD